MTTTDGDKTRDDMIKETRKKTVYIKAAGGGGGEGEVMFRQLVCGCYKHLIQTLLVHG